MRREDLWVIETVDYPNTVLEDKGTGDDRMKKLRLSRFLFIGCHSLIFNNAFPVQAKTKIISISLTVNMYLHVVRNVFQLLFNCFFLRRVSRLGDSGGMSNVIAESRSGDSARN